MVLTHPLSARTVTPLENKHSAEAATALGQNQKHMPGWVKESAMNVESQWIVYRTRFLVRARQLTEPLVFTDALGREQSGRPGDYLVESSDDKSSDGIRRITTQALFEDIYVPLAPTQLATAQLRSPAPGVEIRLPTDGAPDVLARPVSRASPEDRIRATA
jgi:hypothetical protein